MPGIGITFTAIRANAAQIQPVVIREELRWYTKEFCDDLVGEMSDEYPAAPPNPPNDYVRTFRLRNNYRVRNTSSGVGIQYTIDNPVQDRYGRYYASYVQGSAQTWFHARTGWKKWSDVLPKKRVKFTAGAQAIIKKGIKLT